MHPKANFLGLLILTYATLGCAIFERTYHSSPLAIQPLTILSRSPTYDPHNKTLFLTCPSGGAVAQPSPVVYDSHGELVWAEPAFGACTNLNLQSYNGQRVLTFWVGNGNAGIGVQTGNGTAKIVDQAYELVQDVLPRGQGGMDLHEFNIPGPENRTALLTAYNPIPADLTEIGGPADGWYLNALIFEVDIASGEVLFNWTSFDHIALSESFNSLTATSGRSEATAFDAVHINSIAKDANGNYLVSARHTQTIYNIAGSDGRILWRLGGKNSSFTPIGDNATDTQFHWQHDARWHGTNVISLFDDAAAVLDGMTIVVDEPVATGKFLEIDDEKMTVSLLKRFVPAPNAAPVLAEGSTQQYDSHVVVGFGFSPWLTVHDFATGEIFLSATVGPNNASLWTGGINNYRVYQMTTDEFVGTPKTKPAIALVDGSIYVSWNGATRVAEYALLTGPSNKTQLHTTLRKVKRTGFETQIDARGSAGYVQVAALGKDGEVLGMSLVLKAAGGQHYQVVDTWWFEDVTERKHPHHSLLI